MARWISPIRIKLCRSLKVRKKPSPRDCCEKCTKPIDELRPARTLSVTAFVPGLSSTTNQVPQFDKEKTHIVSRKKVLKARFSLLQMVGETLIVLIILVVGIEQRIGRSQGLGLRHIRCLG